MNVDVNWIGVFAATLSSMVVGGIWYSNRVFGKKWAKLAGVKMGGKMTARNMAPLLVVQLLVSFITAYILAHFVFLTHSFFANSWLMDSVTTAFWAWLGFTAVRLLTHDMFEGRRKKLTLLNGAHELVTLLVMGLVLGLLHP